MVVDQTEEKISPLGVANSSAVVHPAGTVALSRTASVGFTCILGVPMATSQDFATWTCSGWLYPRFLVYALRGNTRQIRERMTGSTHKTIYMPDIETLTIPLPPTIAEQRAIADYLDTETARIDALITKKRRMIELLRQRAHESARRVLYGGHTFNNPLEPSEAEAGDRRVTKLSRSFGFGSGTTPSSSNESLYDGGIPWTLTGDLNDGILSEPSRTVTQAAMDSASALKLHPAGALVIAMYGATVGKVAIVEFSTTVNQACSVLWPLAGDSIEYLFHWILIHRRELIDMARGAGQPNISQETLRSIRVAMPTCERQLADVIRLKQIQGTCTDLTVRLTRQTELLIERRQALITAAVTGELVIPGLAA